MGSPGTKSEDSNLISALTRNQTRNPNSGVSLSQPKQLVKYVIIIYALGSAHESFGV